MAHLYAPYQQLLDRHVVEVSTEEGGLVTAFRYANAMRAAETASLLQRQRTQLAAFDPATLKDAAAAIAFWINAYNFFMVAHILENPEDGEPVEGVKSFGSFINPYRVFQRDLFTVGGATYSLDDIEKGILLGEDFAARGWKDARVHFAVNCASVGCPPLRQAIYTAERLDAQLDDNLSRALRTDRHLRVDGDTLYLSRLFDWYEADFADVAGSVRGYVLRYVDGELRQAVEATSDIAYIDYDWSLNRVENFPELAGER
ncbi:DUF547 domain-containing protein [Algiphilus sp.]|uniref:DUF547 domain-containing protein n=1 Tax=Algiphilus sp. TaxID=1872431 RepID=UPI003B52C719